MKSSVLKGASILAISQVFHALSSFLRNIIVARMISTEDYGIASTFALTLALIEMTSNLALDRILVQDEKGDSDEMLGSVHFMQFLKGLITGVILFAIAAPVAHLFNLPELVWAFQLLALIPIFKGLIHWDIVVYQRKLDFFASAMTESLPQVLSLVLAYFAAVWLGDYRVMLVVILTVAFLTAVFSHFYASRPYRWCIDRELINKSFNFGWPLLLNGLLLFAIFQADRAVIATFYDMETLGWYSVAFSLAMLPTLIFAKFSGKLLMPLLAGSRGKPKRFEYFCNLSNIACFSTGIFMVGFFAFGGSALIAICFSERYLVSGTVMLWLGIMQALRIVRVSPTTISNSQAHTKNALIANIFRSVALVMAIYFGYKGYNVEWIAVSGLIGEVIALIVSFYILKLEGFKQRFLRSSFIQISVFLSYAALVSYIAFDGFVGKTVLDHFINLLIGACAGGVAALLVAALDTTAREEAVKLWAAFRKRKTS